ncbi:MAG: LytTR family DNA-binding domain-containing protein [Bacteroidota bacterium]
MINAIIIEDENLAAQRLKMLVEEISDTIQIIEVIPSITQAVRWLSVHTVELIFLDINLADGSAFEIFEQVEIRTPVIFTTAYSQYALRAFEQYSIDYLLKPVTREKLKNSLNKLKHLYQGAELANNIKDMYQAINQITSGSTMRFMVQIGNKFRVIESKEVAYFLSEDKLTFLVTWDNKRYPIDQSLRSLESTLSPNDFFRVNRQFLLHRKAIQELYAFSTSRIKVILTPTTSDDVVVAKDKLGQFKRWLVKS